MKPIEHQTIDGMPREVATAMLSEPRARLTNRMRKNCIAARDRVFVSSSPIVLAVGTKAETDFPDGYAWTQTESRSPEDHMQRRFAIASIAQLGNWLRRSIARRGIVQRRYLAIVGDTKIAQAQRDALAALAERLDTVRDVCESEIAMRKAKCDSIKTVPIGFGSSVKFVRNPVL